jgi:serpin B
MVLVNAIYFYGGWNKEFLKEDTRTADFWQNNGQSVKADFMNAEYNMFYASNENFELLSIPYEKSEATMLVFLPHSKENFERTLNTLSFESYNSLVDQLKQQKVNVTLPKFTMTAEFELKETLSEMGMPIPFSDAADFSAMSAQDELKIDKVIHKAFVDVSEKGTEAAGATAVVITTKSAMPDKEQVIYFKADHPFVFMIKDNATGQILFAGVLNRPEKQ